ncbi:MAG: hypothetical protein DHS20C05_15540 [Hyphococcus sp.]|nr:MAG: hypothetical protein DHS20C05_15540 [Marinicaulis sp.]
MSYDLKTHAQKFAPNYGEHDFSDHLPMAVTALNKLGATEQRVDEFVKTYAKKLKRKKPGAKSLDGLLLSARIGDPTVYPLAYNYFSEAIANEGRVEVLATYLPELTNAIATAAFHGILRTTFGLIANEDSEIAAGLAYWWANAEPVSFSMSIGAANNDVETLIDDVADSFKRHGKKLNLDHPTISARIAEVFASARIGSVLNRAAAANVSFDKIAATALRIYLSTGDFTALHCVTGVHATRILSEHVVMNDVDLRKALWGAICAAYASIGAPPLISLTPAPVKPPDWRVITSAALSSDDEHDIKFAYSCMEEARQYGRDAHYRYAASVRLGLAESPA